MAYSLHKFSAFAVKVEMTYDLLVIGKELIFLRGEDACQISIHALALQGGVGVSRCLFWHEITGFIELDASIWTIPSGCGENKFTHGSHRS